MRVNLEQVEDGPKELFFVSLGIGVHAFEKHGIEIVSFSQLRVLHLIIEVAIGETGTTLIDRHIHLPFYSIYLLTHGQRA